MRVTVKLPEPLRPMAGAASVQVEAKNVAEAIHALARAHPALPGCILNELGELRKHVLIYVGDEDVRYLKGLETPLRGGEVLHIIPSVSGG